LVGLAERGFFGLLRGEFDGRNRILLRFCIVFFLLLDCSSGTLLLFLDLLFQGSDPLLEVVCRRFVLLLQLLHLLF
jgi:hypothetical protein